MCVFETINAAAINGRAIRCLVDGPHLHGGEEEIAAIATNACDVKQEADICYPFGSSKMHETVSYDRIFGLAPKVAIPQRRSRLWQPCEQFAFAGGY